MFRQQFETEACIQPPGGLLAWYPGDGNAYDIVFGNNGSYSGLYAPGKVDQSFSIRGGNNHVVVPNSPNLEPSLLTIDCWVRGTQATDYKWIVAKGGSSCDSGSYGLFVTPIADSIRFIVWNGGSFDGVVEAIVPGLWNDNWHLVAGTYDGSTSKIYVDGVLINSVAYSGGIAYGLPNHNDLIIGSYEGCTSGFNNFAFNGDICEVEIFNRALSLSEILAIYNADVDGKCKSSEIEVKILVKGVRKSNCRHIQMNGITPVVIYGSETFDVTQINCSSLHLGNLSVKVKSVDSRGKKKGPRFGMVTNSKYGPKNVSPSKSFSLRTPDCGCDEETGSKSSKKIGCKIKYSHDCMYPVLVAYFDNTSGHWDYTNPIATLTGYLNDGTPIIGHDQLCI